VSSTHLVLPSVPWRNAGLYPGYDENGPTSGLKPPGMKEALGPNICASVARVWCYRNLIIIIIIMELESELELWLSLVLSQAAR